MTEDLLKQKQVCETDIELLSLTVTDPVHVRMNFRVYVLHLDGRQVIKQSFSNC